mmetsp:Transcript_2424/g.3685  ORF Transcript_2424/g.3685 Transcript_2424/m.3685 type:complete len:276 (+) Transcript_2424:452-1279(+)
MQGMGRARTDSLPSTVGEAIKGFKLGQKQALMYQSMSAYTCTSEASFELVLRQGVQQRSEDGDAATSHPQRCNRGSENEDSRDDDHYALHSVGHRMGHCVELAECQEGDLVVEIVEETSHHHLRKELVASSSKSSLEALEHRCGPFNGKGDGDQQERRHDGDNRIHVCVIHVLPDVSLHNLLAVNSPRSRANVGAHGSTKAEPVERELGSAREADAANDRQQGRVDLPRAHFTQERKVQDGGHHRLRGLDNVAEGYSSCSEGDHGPHMSRQVGQG